VAPSDTVALLRATAETDPDGEAFVDGATRLTFAGWDRAADGLAAALADRGVGKGDVVALLLPSSADYAVCYAAAMRLGAVTTGLNLRLGPSEVAGIVGSKPPVAPIASVAASPRVPGCGEGANASVARGS